MLTYNLEQRNDEPKYYYIYKMIRRDIDRGKHEKGEKLPSKRSLATPRNQSDHGRECVSDVKKMKGI